MRILDGDVNELGDVGGDPGKGCLSYLTCLHEPEIGLSGARLVRSAELGTLRAGSAGLQGEQPLVDRTKWVREVGKTDP
ncbi:hypothetical protein CBOM_00253 [Ceraceosorus bombacis]|uniref:Uncharacterized protein n=1 Tax=Ceraceosorus bombacis TaxID=401625 RepID=A0A0P1A4M9_9BASI|nr:hypothetical protein CBOM_00253 [Ceraceosorus bombacis]